MSASDLDAQRTHLTARLRRARRHLDQQVGAARQLAERGKQVQAAIAELRHEAELYEQAAALLTSIGEQRQATAQAQIETLVTQALRTIFGTELSFHLNPVVRGKRPEIDFVVRSRLDDGTVVDTDVMDARGGGLAAVVGFLLRLVVLLLSGGPLTSVNLLLALDETFAHLSREYEPRMAEFLRELVDRTGVQIILVTHSDAYTDAADTRYQFRLVGGVTEVSTI
jgi:DNA repair exonuclease SbcCD ATPase subunit